MSWWNAKYKNGHGEYEITFASKDYEKAKVVEKVCQAIIDKRIKSRDELPPFLSGKGVNVRTNADHIRSMTDEELAKHNVRESTEYVFDYDWDENPVGEYVSCWCTSDGAIFWNYDLAIEYELRWLKQPFDGGA